MDRDCGLDRVFDQFVAETVRVDRGGTIADDCLQQLVHLFHMGLSDEVLRRQTVHPKAVQVEILNYPAKERVVIELFKIVEFISYSPVGESKSFFNVLPTNQYQNRQLKLFVDRSE